MQIKFGIVSYLPDFAGARRSRITALEELLRSLYKYWPEIPVLIIAQNWQEYQPKVNNILEIKPYNKLGITKARKTLIKEVLNSECDFLIMVDDDSVIVVDDRAAAENFITKIKENKTGFSFRSGIDGPIPESCYAPGQLHLGLISKYILQNVEFPDVSAELDEGFEDTIFANYCHCKYPEAEFSFPAGVRYNFVASYSKVVSTWNTGKNNFSALDANTNKIIKYLKQNKTMPPLAFYSKRTEEL